MRRNSDAHRRHRLLAWVGLSLGLVLRDSWLIAHGGGATPDWLLRTETVAFSLSAAGAAALAASAPAGQRPTRRIAITSVATGSAAVAIHLVRLGLYARRRVVRCGAGAGSHE